MKLADRGPGAVRDNQVADVPMLELRQPRWFSREWDVSERGRSVARLEANRRRRVATLRVGPEAYLFRRTRSEEWEVVDCSTGSALAWTRTPTRDSDSTFIAVQAGDESYFLTLRGLAPREVVVTKYGAPVGWARGRGSCARALRCALPPDLQLATRVFMAWVSLELYRREESIVAATLVVLMGN